MNRFGGAYRNNTDVRRGIGGKSKMIYLDVLHI